MVMAQSTSIIYTSALRVQREFCRRKELLRQDKLWRLGGSMTSAGGGDLLWATVVAPALMEKQSVVRLAQALLAKVGTGAGDTVLGTLFTAATGD